MTISNINITTPNGTNTYAVKAPAVPGGYDYEQCTPSLATGIAVLRYIPSVAEIVAGEVYALGLLNISVSPATIVNDIPFIISGTSHSRVGKTVKVYVNNVECGGSGIVGADGGWSVEVTCTGIPEGSRKLKVVSQLAESSEVDVTVEDGEITGLVTDPESPTEAEDFTIYCDTNIPDGEDITFEYSANGVDNWLPLGTGTTASGSASATVQIPTSGTWYVRARHSTIVYSDNLSVIVASGVEATLNLDATCSASVPKTFINTIETQSMDATCSASTPTSI